MPLNIILCAVCVRSGRRAQLKIPRFGQLRLRSNDGCCDGRRPPARCDTHLRPVDRSSALSCSHARFFFNVRPFPPLARYIFAIRMCTYSHGRFPLQFETQFGHLATIFITFNITDNDSRQSAADVCTKKMSGEVEKRVHREYLTPRTGNSPFGNQTRVDIE